VLCGPSKHATLCTIPCTIFGKPLVVISHRSNKRVVKKYVTIQLCAVSQCPTVPLLHTSCNTQETTLSCVPLSHCYIHHVKHMPLSCSVSHCPTATSIMQNTCHYLVLCPTVPLQHPLCNTHATTLSCVPRSHCLLHHVTNMTLLCLVSHCPTATSIMQHT
jgi:hypothetical protein